MARGPQVALRSWSCTGWKLATSWSVSCASSARELHVRWRSRAVSLLVTWHSVGQVLSTLLSSHWSIVLLDYLIWRTNCLLATCCLSPVATVRCDSELLAIIATQYTSFEWITSTLRNSWAQRTLNLNTSYTWR